MKILLHKLPIRAGNIQIGNVFYLDTLTFFRPCLGLELYRF